MTGRHEKRLQIFPDPRVEVNEWDVDGYPASILVKMGDNTVQEFVRKINQPHPCFEAAMKNLERMTVK